jgi:hypothetical protein
MHEILTKENLKSALLRGIPIEATCENGYECCIKGNLLHDETTDKYSYCDGDALFRNTSHLENLWCVTNTNNGSYRFFTEKPVHSIILKRKQL